MLLGQVSVVQGEEVSFGSNEYMIGDHYVL